MDSEKNPFWTKKFMRRLLDYEHRKPKETLPDSAEDQRQEAREQSQALRRLLKDVVLIIGGMCSAAFGLESFLLPSNFIDGGVTGISLLTAELSGAPLYLLLVLINTPFIILAYNTVGHRFAMKTGIAILGLAVLLATAHFPEVTHDKLLVAIFGGFFLGAGIGLSIRGGAVLDGTEVLAIFLSRRLGTTIGDLVIAINILVFSAAAYFLSVESALYSMITYLAASKTLDFIIEGIEEYTGVTIVSANSEEIKQMIVDVMGRGVTVYKGKGGFGKKGQATDVDIIYSVVTRLEINKFKTEVEKIDPEAFMVLSSVKETRGGMIKKRPLAH